MAIVRARSPVVWIRRILLAAGLLGVGALGVMLAAYRFGKSGLEPAPETRAAAATDASTLTASEGFGFVHYIEGRQIFRIQAEKSVQDRQDTTYLETVVLDIYREDGATYRVTSNSAQVNESSWDALLEGDVVVSGWGDLELEARAFDLQQQGQVLVSRGAVKFRAAPDLEGRATQLRLDRSTDTISLSGGVHIKSADAAESPMRLDCERLVYRRAEGLIRALDDVRVSFGDQELRTRALTLFLLEDRKSLRSLRARWDVVGSARTATDFGGETRVEFRGQFLELEPSPEDPGSRKIRLEGSPDEVATVTVVDAEGLGRTLRAQVLESESIGGRPAYIRGRGDPLVIDEFLDLAEPFPLRQLCAREGSAHFLADGTLSQIFLETGVEVWDRDLYLSGGTTARFELANGKIEIEGPSVELFSERGDLAAPRIVYRRDEGVIRAESGVRASLESGTATALEQTPFGQGQGPIRVEAREAFYTTQPPAFTFRGAVRAWRNENLILAEELRGDQAARQMSASGGVQTLWFSAPRANGPPSAPPQPLEVRADLLTYRQRDGVVVYSGNVRLEQGRQTLTCDDLAVELDDAGHQAERMRCRGDVRLIDPVAKRQVFGETAVYNVAADTVEVYGERVRLIEENNELEGAYLFYDLAAGKVRIGSQAPAAGVPTAGAAGAGTP